MDEFTREALSERTARRAARQRLFWHHVVLWASVNLLLIVIWAVTGAGFPWFVFPLFGWLVALALHGSAAYVLRGSDHLMLEHEARRPM